MVKIIFIFNKEFILHETICFSKSIYKKGNYINTKLKSINLMTLFIHGCLPQTPICLMKLAVVQESFLMLSE